MKKDKTTKEKLIDKLFNITDQYDTRILSNQTIAELKILIANEKESGSENCNQWCKIK